MLSRLSTTVVAALALAQSVVAQLTPAHVAENINLVVNISMNANNDLVPLAVESTTSPVLESSFQQIIQSVSAVVEAMNATPPFSDDQAGQVIDALDIFIAIHQTLLGTVIGKHTIFARFGLTAPITAVLRTLETGVDAFAESLIDLIPTKTEDAQTGTGQLDKTVQTSINTYSEICIPSPLYPTVLPVCVAV